MISSTPKIRINELLWDDENLTHLHDLRAWEVESAIIDDPHREARWVEDEEHGRRLMAEGRCEDNSKRIRTYLDPVNEADGIWKPRTAWRSGA